MGVFRIASWLSAERATAYARILFVLMGAGLVFDAVSTVLGHHPGGAVLGPAGMPAATDFLAFWAAGHLAWAGRAATVYDLTVLAAVERGAAIMPAGTLLAFFYPPTFLLLCLPFAAVPYLVGWAAFVVLPLAALAVGLRRILPAHWMGGGVWCLWGFLPVAAFPGLMMNTATGQTGFWSGACFAWALLWLETRPALAGACLGMLVIKPHLALAVPVVLVAGRRWRALAACAATAGAWMALSWLALGTAAWRGFFAAAPLIRDTLENHREDWGKLQSLYTSVRLMGAPLWAAYGAQVAVAALVLAVLARFAWRRPGGRAEIAAMTAGAMLCTPHILDYDLAALGVPLAWLAACAARDGWLPWEKLVAGLVFVWPLVARIVTPEGVAVAPVLLGLLLWVVVRRAGSKVFFSEEKKQKTFGLLSRTFPAAYAKSQKFFGSFFQKRTLSFP
jgi:hypothetical protein